MVETFFENDNAKISLNSPINTIIFQLLTPVVFDAFHLEAKKIIDAFRNYQTGKLLLDMRNLDTIHSENIVADVSDWLHNAISAGHWCCAIILPNDLSAKLSLKNIVEQMKSGIQYRYFDSYDAAIEWIAKQHFSSVCL